MALNNWMANFTGQNNWTLSDITFPASHDAGVSLANGCYESFGCINAADSTICQQYDILGQLQRGSRALDVRVGSHGMILRTFHGGKVGGWGQTFDSILTQIGTFLTANTGEIVILRITHTKPEIGIRVLNNIINFDQANQNILYKAQTTNLAAVPLSLLRGHLIVVFDSNALATDYPNQGFWRYQKYPTAPPVNGLMICGKYDNTCGNKKKAINHAIDGIREHGAHRDPDPANAHLLMVYWQRALDVQRKATHGQEHLPGDWRTITAVTAHRAMHYNLAFLLNMCRGIRVAAPPKAYAPGNVNMPNITNDTRGNYKPNWINIDFIKEDVCRMIVEFNADMLGIQANL